MGLPVWSVRMSSLAFLMCLLVPATVLAWNQNCITKPVGFGHKTTGGQGGKTVTPRTPDELKRYLASKENLNIVLDRTYDFTNSEGTAKSTGCFFKKCGSGFQESLAHAGTCNGRPATTVKYSKAGTTGLVVASNKSVYGVNGKGVIKGKGLALVKVKNVILRDFTISDINPQVIWAGDAIAFTNVENVWVHRLTIARIGRQFVVAHQGVNKGITISSCLFDGTTKTSAYCNGNHYWVWLFWGSRDEITLINNKVINTSGRTPHAGGWAKASNFVHLIANEFDNNKNAGIEPNKGSNILAEGNSYSSFAHPVNPSAKGGHLAMVNSASQAATCKKYLGKSCLINKYSKSKSPNRFEVSVLQQFSKLDRQAINSAQAAACL